MKRPTQRSADGLLRRPNVKRILIVDDEFGIVEALTDVLASEGYAVSTASNGRQALERLESERPDLLITDYMMPVMNGAELVAEAKRRWSALPIILMTAIDHDQVPPSLDVGAVLRKPFSLDELMRILRALMG